MGDRDGVGDVYMEMVRDGEKLKEDEFIEIKQYKVQLNIVTSAQIYWCPLHQ